MKTRCTTCNRHWITSILKQNTDEYTCPVCSADGKRGKDGRVITAINRAMIILTVVIIIASIVMLHEINQIHEGMDQTLAEIEILLETE